MRQNALKTHEELHDRAEGKPINPAKDPAPVRLKEIKLKTIRSRQGRILGGHYKRGNEKFYRCHYCPNEEKFCADLCLHSRNHFMKDASLQCEKCNFKTNLPKKMEEHKRAHPREDGKKNPGFKCTECPFQAKSYAKLWHHIQKHKKTSRFTCPRCSFSTGSLTCLNLHIVLHGEAPIMIKKPMLNQQKKQSKEKLDENEVDDDSRKEESPPTEPMESESSIEASEASSVIVEMEEDIPETSSIEKIDTEDAELDPTERLHDEENSQDVSASETATPIVPIEYPEVEKMEEFVILKLDIPPLPPLLRPYKEEADSDSEASSSTIYRCPHCPFECSDEVVLKIHNEMHYSQRPFKCTMCSFNCFSAEALHTHLSLHAPPLSPLSAMTMRKRMAAKRRNGALHSPEVLPPNASNVLQCNQCSYKTMFQDRFAQHRMEHVQLLQQRLMTTIKRSTNDDMLPTAKIKRAPKRTDKMYNCTKCGFRSDTSHAFTRHLEFHEDEKAIFRCSICDYGADTHNVVLFHEQNHHLDVPLTYLCQTKHLNGYHQNETPAPSFHIQQKLRCGRCDFRCHEIRDFSEHWDVNHAQNSKKDREIAELLKLQLISKASIVDKYPNME
uniref:C2H2-type domain-containing protein n=1 Tax=Acrobeloides nanus TaxID=290746 RepID=A0A914CTJ6_9BILA